MMTTTRTEAGAASIGAVAGVVAILVVVGGVFLGLRSGDDPSSASPPADQATSDSNAESESTEQSPSETGSSDDGQEAWVAEAVVAAKDGFPAFVPADIPAGWTAGDAAYVPDTSWHMELVAPSGATVSIDQRLS